MPSGRPGEIAALWYTKKLTQILWFSLITVVTPCYTKVADLELESWYFVDVVTAVTADYAHWWICLLFAENAEIIWDMLCHRGKTSKGGGGRFEAASETSIPDRGGSRGEESWKEKRCGHGAPFDDFCHESCWTSIFRFFARFHLQLHLHRISRRVSAQLKTSRSYKAKLEVQPATERWTIHCQGIANCFALSFLRNCLGGCSNCHPSAPSQFAVKCDAVVCELSCYHALVRSTHAQQSGHRCGLICFNFVIGCPETCWLARESWHAAIETASAAKYEFIWVACKKIRNPSEFHLNAKGLNMFKASKESKAWLEPQNRGAWKYQGGRRCHGLAAQSPRHFVQTRHTHSFVMLGESAKVWA